MMYMYSEEGVKSSENSSTPKKEVCTMFRSLFRSSFSRILRRGGGSIPAKGNRTLFGVVGVTRAVITAARRRSLESSLSGPALSRTVYQTGKPYRSLGRIAPMKIVAK